MKIESVEVHDPRRAKLIQSPMIEIQVDEPVEEIADQRFLGNLFGYGWAIVPCGPFMAIECCPETPDGTWTDVVDIGVFNKTGFHHEQLVSVSVWSPGEGHLDLQIGVARMQRLLRQHTGRGMMSWRLIVDEHAALEGKITWRLFQKDGLCFDSPCKNDVVAEVYKSGVYLPFCASHHRRYNLMERARRLETSNL